MAINKKDAPLAGIKGPSHEVELKVSELQELSKALLIMKDFSFTSLDVLRVFQTNKRTVDAVLELIGDEEILLTDRNNKLNGTDADKHSAEELIKLREEVNTEYRKLHTIRHKVKLYTVLRDKFPEGEDQATRDKFGKKTLPSNNPMVPGEEVSYVTGYLDLLGIVIL